MHFLTKRFSAVCVTVLLIALSLWSILPLFHEGLHTSHDMWHQVARIHHYSQALSEGVIFPQWIMQLAYGHGYPLFLFSYHFPWLFTYPLISLGISEVLALKIVFGFFFVLPTVSMFLLARHITKNTVLATVVAALYLVAPYHYLSLYVAAAVGTVIVYAILPLTGLGLHWIAEQRLRAGVLLTGVSIAVLVLTHLMSVALFAPLLALYAVMILLLHKKHWKQTMLGYLAAAALAILLAAYYLVPLLTYLPATNAQSGEENFARLYQSNFITPKQLLYSPWGFGPIVENAKDGEISLQLGLAHWAGLAVCLGVLVVFFTQKYFGSSLKKLLPLSVKKPPRLLAITLAMVVVSMVLLFEISSPYWETITKVSSVDYPFRLLTLTLFFSTLSIGLALQCIQQGWIRITTSILLVLLTVYANRNHVRVNLYWTEDIAGFVASEITTNTFHEYSPKGDNGEIFSQKDQGPILGHPATVLSESTQHRSVSVTATQSADLEFGNFPFPGITAFVDGQKVNTGRSKQGRLLVPVPEGEHTVVITFVPTTVSKVSLWISLVAWFSIVGYWLYNRKYL